MSATNRSPGTPRLNPYEDPHVRWVDTTTYGTCGRGRLFVDLFAGAGGLSHGFQMAGFRPAMAVERDPDACTTYARSFPEAWLHAGPIEDLTEELLLMRFAGASPDVVCGGPPCQAFSTAGRRDPSDPRGHLFREFARIVGILRPHFVVLENVPGVLSVEGGSRLESILGALAAVGYPRGSVMMLEAAEHGVPQFRRRLFIVANRHGLQNPRPSPSLARHQFVPVESALDDLKARPRDPGANHEWTNHSAEMQERLSRLAPGETLYAYSGSWRRLRVGVPAPTIKANNGAPHVHYELPRTISAREMARTQTFPDDVLFSGDMASVMLQVGNAVPPLLARAVAIAVGSSLESLDAQDCPLAN